MPAMPSGPSSGHPSVSETPFESLQKSICAAASPAPARLPCYVVGSVCADAASKPDDDATQSFGGSSDENEDEDDATQAFGDEDDDAGGGQPQEKAAPMEAISAVGKQYQDTAALISAISTEASAIGTSLRCLDGTARWHTEASAIGTGASAMGTSLRCLAVSRCLAALAVSRCRSLPSLSLAVSR